MFDVQSCGAARALSPQVAAEAMANSLFRWSKIAWLILQWCFVYKGCFGM